MCGYVGFTNRIVNASSVLSAMMDKIRHRGPDSEGTYVDGDIALGFRRLSIIDLAQGDQPLFNEDGSMVLVFNGEIYNYRQLREELCARGHIFSTQTDSEVLLHGYEEYGAKLLPRLRGMFSFAIWDKVKKELFAARDPFGIKPLYYTAIDDVLLFGSEIKAFLPYPDFHKELNETALENYLTFQYSPTEETFFQGVRKLLPAHYLHLKGDRVNIRRYWEPKFKPDNTASLHDWVDAIGQTFEESVKAHKISDVEVGSFLSSGVDSSYVASVANVDKTFTVGFSDRKYNEISYAKEFSKLLGVRNYNKTITPEEYWNVLPLVQYHMDEPLADPSAVALFFVCQTAARHVKVVLSGEGADELFGGYNIYREPSAVPAYNLLPLPVRRIVADAASRFPHKRGVNFLMRRGKTLEERFIGNAYIFSEEERKALLRKPTNAPPAKTITRPLYNKVRGADDITRMQYLDIHLWLAGDILLKADKMSMAHSLELRVPFLDREVMALASRIPAKHRITKENTKYAMRLAARKRMPKQVADKKKLGFPVPIRVWLKEDNYYQTVKQAFTSAAAKKFFHTDGLIALLDEHRAGTYDNSRKIWTIYTFLVWYDVYFG